VLLLFAQPANFSVENVPVPSVRTNFNATQFLESAGLDAPIGGDMFLCGDPNSGPSEMPNICAVTTTSTTSVHSVVSTSGYAASPSGVVTFTSSASLRKGLDSLVLGVCGLILIGVVGL